MSNIQELGIPGVGSGILHPKHRNRFRVLFKEPSSDQIIDALHPLSHQMIAIDIGAEDLTGYEGLHHRTGRVVLTLEDDVTAYALKAIRGWQEVQKTGKLFDLWHETLDGNERVMDSYIFRNCVMEALQHATWRYDVPTSTSLRLYMPQTHVSGMEAVDFDPISKAILQGMTVTFTGKNPEIPGVCQKLLQIGFQSYEHKIHD